MSRHTLVLVATVCGLVMILSLWFFPLVSFEGGGSRRAISHPSGNFLLLFSWVAGGFAGLVLLKRAERLGFTQERSLMFSLLGFKLAGFFFLALLFDGAGGGSWGLGFWLAFIASIAGAFVVYLTFNPGLARRIAEATQEKGSSAGKPPAAPPPAS